MPKGAPSRMPKAFAATSELGLASGAAAGVVEPKACARLPMSRVVAPAMRFAALVCVATASLLARPACAQMGPEAQAEVEQSLAERPVDPMEWTAWYLRLERLYNVRVSSNL